MKRTPEPTPRIVAVFPTQPGAWLGSARVAANSGPTSPIETEVERVRGGWAVVAVWDRDVLEARAILRQFQSWSNGEVLS